MEKYSLSNPEIQAYFESDIPTPKNVYVPEEEFLYIHAHPLVRPNFMTEISDLIQRAAKVVVKRNMSGAITERFAEAAKELGMILGQCKGDPTLDQTRQMLEIVKKVYLLSKAIIVHE